MLKNHGVVVADDVKTSMKFIRHTIICKLSLSAVTKAKLNEDSLDQFSHLIHTAENDYNRCQIVPTNKKYI